MDLFGLANKTLLKQNLLFQLQLKYEIKKQRLDRAKQVLSRSIHHSSADGQRLPSRCRHTLTVDYPH